ncbi:MAG: response regulator [Desulfosalsimonadaceae bacterium]|nr:response regulator [Desulfosalsimonadaceae bacterium]
MRILLVDDEEEFVATQAERLSLRDIEADWVTSAREAEQIVDTRHYDLVVLDVKMPHMGGRQLKQILEKKLPGIKTIYLTGHGSEEDYKAGSAEAEYYLMKPININDLIDKIKTALAT